MTIVTFRVLEDRTFHDGRYLTLEIPSERPPEKKEDPAPVLGPEGDPRDTNKLPGLEPTAQAEGGPPNLAEGYKG